MQTQAGLNEQCLKDAGLVEIMKFHCYYNCISAITAQVGCCGVVKFKRDNKLPD